MADPHQPRPGTGVAYYDPPEKRRSDKAPEYTGFITLEMDYKAGEKVKFGIWTKETSSGFTLLSLREDNWSKKQNELKEQEKDRPKEIQPRTFGLNKPAPMHSKIRVDDDDVPF